jgi:hypothetical protein
MLEKKKRTFQVKRRRIRGIVFSKNIVVKEGGALTIAAPSRLKAMVREFKTA